MTGYLTLAETARALRVSAATIRDLARRGRFLVRPDGWTLAGLLAPACG